MFDITLYSNASRVPTNLPQQEGKSLQSKGEWILSNSLSILDKSYVQLYEKLGDADP